MSIQRIHLMTFKFTLLLGFCFVTNSIQAQDQPSDSKNRLPQKQHKTSDAPFLNPSQAVAQMAIPDGFDVSILLRSRTLPNQLRSALTIGGGCGSRRTSITRPDENTPMNRLAEFRFLKILTAMEPLTKKRHSPTN